MTVLDLRKYRLRSGESLRDEQEIEIAPVELGGQRYIVVPETVPAELTVTRASTGTVYELRFSVRVHGPCVRCLGDAVLEEELRLREYQADLCPVCGLDLNSEPHAHEDEEQDPRWAALGELRDRL